jgi:hypothetical protein
MGSVALFRDGNEFKYFNLDGDVFTYTTFNEALQNNAVHVHSYNAATNAIVFGGEATDTVNTTAILSGIANFGMHLYVVSNPAINGDPMRGHYLYLDLSNNSTTPVETYAINVDYENTKLDGSVGGN